MNQHSMYNNVNDFSYQVNPINTFSLDEQGWYEHFIMNDLYPLS